MKTIEVQNLKIGDKFIVPSDSLSSDCPSVYVVTDKDKFGWADCVEINSGKEFSMGRSLVVVPVEVDLVVNFEK